MWGWQAERVVVPVAIVLLILGAVWLAGRLWRPKRSALCAGEWCGRIWHEYRRVPGGRWTQGTVARKR